MANEKRLIDANAVIASLRESLDELRKICDGLARHDEKQICNGQICTFLEAIMRIREQPTVDAVEVVHGRWIVEHEESIRCSECCFNRAHIKMPMDYCPNCGAKMDGE